MFAAMSWGSSQILAACVLLSAEPALSYVSSPIGQGLRAQALTVSTQASGGHGGPPEDSSEIAENVRINAVEARSKPRSSILPTRVSTATARVDEPEILVPEGCFEEHYGGMDVVIAQICKDLPRTDLWGLSGTDAEALARKTVVFKVLKQFADRRPEIGYGQGMHSLGAVAVHLAQRRLPKDVRPEEVKNLPSNWLAELQAEALKELEWVMHNLPPQAFSAKPEVLDACWKTWSIAALERVPGIGARLQGFEFPILPEAYMYDWFGNLFAAQLSVETLVTSWKTIFSRSVQLKKDCSATDYPVLMASALLRYLFERDGVPEDDMIALESLQNREYFKAIEFWEIEPMLQIEEVPAKQASQDLFPASSVRDDLDLFQASQDTRSSFHRAIEKSPLGRYILWSS